MKFKEFLANNTKLVAEGGQDWEAGHGGGGIPSKFDDSVDATEFMGKIGDMLNADALDDWCKETDSNFDVSTRAKLSKVYAAYNDFMNEMEKAA